MKKNMKKIILLILLSSVNLFAENTLDLKTNTSAINESNIIGTNRQNILINKFEIVGNKNINLDEYTSSIKKGDIFEPNKIQELMNKIMLTGYFSNIKPEVSVDAENKNVNIKLEVKENPIIKTITLNGLTIMTPKELEDKIGLKAGSVYNYYILDPQKSPIIVELVKKGLLAPAIINANMDENGNLIIDISEGKITKIEYVKKGEKPENVRLDANNFNLKTKEFIFKRNQTIKVGEFLTIEGVKTTSQNLFRTGLFESIEPKFEFDPSNPQGRIVIFEIEERRTASINAQLSYSKDSGIVGELSLSDKNFLGGQQEASVSASFGTTGSYNLNASYWNPWIRNTDKIQAGGKIYFNRDKVNSKDLLKEIRIDDDTLYGELAQLIKPYDTKTIGISGTVGKGVAKDVYISLKPQLSTSFSNTKYGIKLTNSVQGGASLSFSYDTRDDTFLPKSGAVVTYTLEGNYVMKDSSLTPAAIKESKNWLLNKQNEVINSWDDAKKTEYFVDYKKKEKEYKDKNPGKEFNPVKENLSLTNEGKKEITKLRDSLEKEFKEKVKEYRENGIGTGENKQKGKFNSRFYGKFDLEILGYKPIIKDINSLAVRFNLGMASKSASGSSLFITDNYGKSFRGYQDVNTTNFLISTTLENRFYVNKYLQVVVFSDSGIYAKPNENMKETSEGYTNYQTPVEVFKNFDKQFKLSVGAGVRINTPIGIIRLDYGLPLINRDKQKGGKLSFGFGHTF